MESPARDLLGHVDVVGEHADDALDGGVVEIVLAAGLPDRAIDAGQVGDVDLFGVFLGERDLGRARAPSTYLPRIGQGDRGLVLRMEPSACGR